MIAALLASGPLAAQTGRISGTVTSAEGGRPLSGAVVRVAGSAARALTQPDGTYSIVGVAPGSRQVTAEVLGHAAQTRTVTVAGGQAATANFALASSAVTVEGVVAVGYGERRVRDVTGSVAAVSEDEFNGGRVISTEQLIQAKVPGVQVIETGEPGSSVAIRIRGGTSVNASSEPLFVVDGVPLPVGGGLSAGRNPLSFISPEDVARVTVLKDAASTAIYGSRGANGVIIVETKSGNSAGPQISYSNSFSTSRVTNEPDFLSADEFRQVVQERYPSKVGQLGSADTDWRGAVERNGAGQQHEVAVAGSGQNMNYRLSVGYLDQQGVIRGTELERISTAINYNHRLFDNRLSVKAMLRGSRSEDQFTPGGVLGSATNFNPTQPITTETGFWEAPSAFPLAPNNPLAELAYAVEEGTTFRSVGNVEAQYRMPFLEELSATVRMSYDVARSERRGFWPSTLQSQVESPVSCSAPPCPTGTVNRSNPSESTTGIDAYLNYVTHLDGFNSDVDATAGYSYESFVGDYPFLQARGLDSDLLGINGIPPAAENTSSIFVNESKLASFFGRVNYTYADRYLLTLSLRRDASSRFGPDRQWATAPAVALGWRISDESFMERYPFISELKLRASWGQNGNQTIPNYGWISRYTYGDQFAQVQFGDDFVSTIRPTAVDPAIHWEETTSTNIGVDFGLFQNRLTGAIEYYVKDTDDLLFDKTIPAGANLTNHVLTNVGSVRNRGLELSLNTRILEGRTGGLSWDASFNAATNRNRLIELTGSDAGAERIMTGGISGGVGNNVEVIQEGLPMRTFMVYHHLRDDNGKPIYSSNEMDMYEDINGDGQITQEDRRPFHSPTPQWILGHTSTFTWRSFDMSATLRAQLGNYVYNNTASGQGFYDLLNQAGGLVNLHRSAVDYGFTTAQFFSDVYVEDASFLRMDNLTLGYNVANFRGARDLRVFGTVQNVFTLTGYSGVDPEAGLGGIDNNIYPRSRTFSAGVNIGF